VVTVNARKRHRLPKGASYANGALALALDGLHGAVAALCNPRPYPKPGGAHTSLDSRYH
jgi:hypothetical protein